MTVGVIDGRLSWRRSSIAWPNRHITSVEMIVEVKGTVEGIERLPFEAQAACIVHGIGRHRLGWGEY